MKRISVAFLAAALVSAALLAQNSARPGDGDWPMYSRDPAGTRFSPLTQINAGNVSTLTQVWTVRVTPPAAGRGRGGRGPAAGAGRSGGTAGGGWTRTWRRAARQGRRPRIRATPPEQIPRRRRSS